MHDLPELVPKIEGSNDRQFGSGAPVSINTLKATVAADLEKLAEMYESKIKAKHEQNMKWKNEWIDMKLERDLYSDKCKSLGRENLELKEIVGEQKKEIESSKEWSLKKLLVKRGNRNNNREPVLRFDRKMFNLATNCLGDRELRQELIHWNSPDPIRQ